MAIKSVLAAHGALGGAIRKGNRKAAERLLAAQFTWTDETGRSRPRARFLGDLASLAPAGADKAVKVTDYGRVAMVTGRRKSAHKTEVFFVEVWVKGSAGWRVLVHQDNVLAAASAAPAHAPQPRKPQAPPPACANPCELVPYRARSQAERDIITAFQSLEKAVTRNDDDAWTRHMADEFVVYRTRQPPTRKADRIALMRRLRAVNAETFVAEVAWMKLWVLGDAAVMRADHVMPGNRRPPYRATRVWVKRDGHWQMAVSQQTAMAG